MLDWQTCEQARLARDARFDGRFFTAVLTTGIFCRPICPAPVPRSENVRYFPSAAAASEAGFRPCLRCRPEAAPGSQLWQGQEALVGRAQALIQTGFLNQQSVPALAARLGVGERQLGRLFQASLGASPKAVANMQRLLFAKQLLHETSMTMTDVAMASGFNSLRRFNDAFHRCYGRAPSELRGKPRSDAEVLTLRLSYRPPLDWPALLGWLRLRAIPGVEQVSDNRYRRSICLKQQTGWIEVSACDDQPVLRLSVHFPDLSQLMDIVARVRRLFDLDANLDAIHACLAQDTVLAPMLKARPGLRLPGAWEPFEFAVRAVLGQQISVQAATTIAGRLVARCGTPMPTNGAELAWVFPDACALAAADLSGIGLTGKRMATLQALANALVAGELNLQVGQELDGFVARLCALPGIGDWTAHYIAMRALSEPDAFPAADLGLMKALGLTKPKDIRQRAEHWRPWRAYAAIHLWQSLGD